MSDITIEGLNQRQRVLADILWACSDIDEVDRFINALPTQALRRDARAVMEVMKVAVLDCVDGTEAAETVLRQLKGQ